MSKAKGGFFESVYNKNKKGTSFLVGALLTLTSGVAVATDLTVSDKQGVTYLKVDAPQGSSLDLKVTTNSKSATTETLTLKRVGESTGLNKSLSLSDKEVMFDDVKVGTYTLTSSSPLLKVEEVSVVPENIAKSEEGSKDLEKAGYAVGGVALIGGIVGATAGGGVFGSSDSSGDGNPARSGSLGSNGGSDGASVATDPRVVSDPRLAPSFDPNRPDVVGPPNPAPNSINTGTTPGGQPVENPFVGSQGNPNPMAAPSVVEPRTPS